MKRRIIYFLSLPLFAFMSSCGTPSSITTSFNCSGNMLIERNSIGAKSERNRSKVLNAEKKAYQKKYNRKRI